MSGEGISNLNPRQFVLKVRGMRAEVRAERNKKIQDSLDIGKKYSAEIRAEKEQIRNFEKKCADEIAGMNKKCDEKTTPLEQEKQLVLKKYLVDNPFGILVYVDRVEFGRDAMSFDSHIRVNYEVRTQEYSRTLKNGQVRYYTRNVKCIVFSNNNGSFAVAIDAKVTEIRRVIEWIQGAIADYPESKNKLDAEVLSLDKKLSNWRNARDKSIQKVKEETEKNIGRENAKIQELRAKKTEAVAKSDKAHEARIEAMQAEIRQMIADASDVQLKELRRPRKIAVVLGFLVVLVVGIPILVGNILDTMTMMHERDRVYGIEIKNEFLFDCAGEYDEQQKVINCGEFEINGKYTHYATTSLWAGSSSGFLVNGNEFTKKLSKMSISKSFWETENFDLEKLASYGQRTEKFGLYNEFLDETGFEKSAEIRYVFSEETYALIQELHEKWKIEEAERKAREEAERKAREEERKAREEVEKREKEEAEQREREEAERREREEAEQKAAEERARQEAEQYSAPVAPYTPPASNPAPSTPGYTSPSSGVNYNMSGYCNDGTYVTGNPAAKGKANACYGHGGWRDY